MSKARILADLISDSQITASEITGLELNAIQQGDTVVEVSDTGSGGKVVVRVDGADNAEFNAGGMVIPKGTTAQRDPAAVVGSLRYNTTTGFFETFTVSGWGAVATPPSITGVTPSNFSGEAGSTFTVDGAFFDGDTTAVFKGADGTEYAAATVTFVSNNQITLTNATNLPVANEPFKVKVTNGAGLFVESVQGIDAGSVPAFTTAAGNIATTTRWDNPVSVTVQATDAENTISGYSLTQGNLPAGLSLNATTGAITGTSTEQATTTYTFTIEATDSAGNTNTRQFNIQIVNAAPVWSSPAEGSTQAITVGSAGSITLNATDPENAAVIYTSGTLPAGLSLSGSVISGTPTVEANTGVAVTASDGFSSSVRNFFVNVIPNPYYNILPARNFHLQTDCSFTQDAVDRLASRLADFNADIGGNPSTTFSISVGGAQTAQAGNYDFAIYASGCGGNLENSSAWQSAYGNNGVGIGVFQVGGYQNSGNHSIGDLYSQAPWGNNSYTNNTSSTAALLSSDFQASEIIQRVMQQEYVDGTYSGNSNITIDWKYYIGPMTSTSHERGTLGSYTNTQSYKLFNVFETNGKRYVYLNYNPFESSGSPIQSANNADNDVEAMRILVALLYWGAGDINSSNALKF